MLMVADSPIEILGGRLWGSAGRGANIYIYIYIYIFMPSMHSCCSGAGLSDGVFFLPPGLDGACSRLVSALENQFP